jgi:WD40 repeat protein
VRECRLRASLAAVAALLSLAGCGGGGGACGSSITSGDLYFTRYSGAPNLEKVHFDYKSGKFTLAKPAAVATLNGVDGVVFAPDGDLLVGGQGDVVHKVHVANGKTVDVRANATAYHLSLDPGGKKVWATGIPGPLAEIPLSPFSKGVAHRLTGDDENITSIAFDGSGRSYYTSSGAGGGGSVGRIDLKKFTTKRVISDLPAAHGMVFDRFTGDLLLFGATHITQIDPSSMKVVSDLTISAGVVLDQGTVDGHGYVFVASNEGQIVFVDYTGTKKVGAKGNQVIVQFVAPNLDDVAPLSGAGAASCTAA